MRAWYNGSTKASQALDEGSIPFARTKNKADLCVGYIFGFVGWKRTRTKRGRKQVDFGSETHQNRHGFPAGKNCRGTPFARTTLRICDALGGRPTKQRIRVNKNTIGVKPVFILYRRIKNA